MPRKGEKRGGGSAPEEELFRSLRALYDRIDDALAGWACDASTDCCRFGVTGREPYPTAVELAVLERAVRARGGLPKRRLSLPLAERTCPLLGDDGRCLVYASRPFGCRTFYCDRARGPAGEVARALPRDLMSETARAIADLSSRYAPSDPGPRPLSRAAAAWRPASECDNRSSRRTAARRSPR